MELRRGFHAFFPTSGGNVTKKRCSEIFRGVSAEARSTKGRKMRHLNIGGSRETRSRDTHGYGVRLVVADATGEALTRAKVTVSHALAAGEVSPPTPIGSEREGLLSDVDRNAADGG